MFGTMNTAAVATKVAETILIHSPTVMALAPSESSSREATTSVAAVEMNAVTALAYGASDTVQPFDGWAGQERKLADMETSSWVILLGVAIVLALGAGLIWGVTFMPRT